MAYLDALFTDGAELTSNGDRLRIELIEAGRLHLPTGELVSTDPFALPNRPRFWRTVSAGRYPVLLSLAHPSDASYAVIAAAKLKFGDGRAVRWALATAVGQETSALAGDELLGFPVDSGTAAFMSPESARAFSRRIMILGVIPNLSFIMQLGEEMERHSPEAPWIVLEFGDGGLNAVLFTSGFGDGVYASYWWFDAGGHVACLVTDFGVIGGLPSDP